MMLNAVAMTSMMTRKVILFENHHDVGNGGNGDGRGGDEDEYMYRVESSSGIGGHMA